MRDRGRDWGDQGLPILRAAVPLARSSLSITVDEKRKGLRAVCEGPGISTQPTNSTKYDLRVSVSAKFRRLPRRVRFSVRLLSRSVFTAGTRAYCPPEFFVRDQYHATPGTVWSLGCMMFDLLTWKMPFKNPRNAVTAPLIIPENLSKGEYKLLQKQTYKQTNKQASTQTNKQTSKQTNKQTNKRANKQANKQTNYRLLLHGVCCEKALSCQC